MKLTALAAALVFALSGALAGCEREGGTASSGGTSASGSSSTSGAGGTTPRQNDPAGAPKRPASPGGSGSGTTSK